MSTKNTVPEGYMRNAAGHLVPCDQVRFIPGHALWNKGM